jgi:large subunit ribosomal protein L18
MNEKKQSRLRRAKSTRLHIRALGATRLCVNRTPRHIYAQVISADGGKVLAQASTLDATLRAGTTGNVEAATKVGALLQNALKQLVLLKLHLTVLVSNIMVVSKPWLMLLVKTAWSSNHG